MKAFLTGLLVIFLVCLLTVLAVLLFPFIIVLGFFLKWFIAAAFVIFSIWLIGKVALWFIYKART